MSALRKPITSIVAFARSSKRRARRLRAIHPFPRFMGNGVVPGSQTFTTPGVHNFTVPAYNLLTVIVRGPGGSGNAGIGVDGNPGTANSSFGGAAPVVGNLGGAGTSGGQGADGAASGGDTNTTGGAANGGAGLNFRGGHGGQAVKTWNSGVGPSQGANITVFVAQGGASAGGPSVAGGNGSVQLIWS